MMHQRPFCPHCGFNLEAAKSITLGDFHCPGPEGPLIWRGIPVRLTGSEYDLCWALMSSAPANVAIDTLLERMDSDGGHNVVRVFVHRVRAKFRAVGAPNPFKASHAHGRPAYRWEESRPIARPRLVIAERDPEEQKVAASG